MRGPLAVTIVDGAIPQHVTRHVDGLRFTKTAPGGFHSASMVLRLPRGTFPDLGPADRVIVTDARSGRVVWEGFAENPGTTDGPGGQEYDLSAIGTVTLTGDNSSALIFVDRDLTSWTEGRDATSAPSGSAQVSDDPAAAEGTTGAEGILCQINPGQPIGTGKRVSMRYTAGEEANTTVGALLVSTVSGKIDAGYVAEIAYFTPTASGTSNLNTALSTTRFTFTRYADGTDMAAGVTRIDLRIRRTGAATNVADDDTWTLFYDVTVVARLRDRFGAAVAASAYSGGVVNAAQVVEDLLGRAMLYVDKNASRVEAASAPIDQLAYPDGAPPQQVLDDLSLWEPDRLWEVREHTGNGYRFNYRAWPTTPRYEISAARDGFTAPGGDVDLCNRIAVYWTDPKGNRRTTVVTSVVPALDAVGRTRDAEPIELEDGRGSEANALLIGQQALAAKNTAPKAGTASVARWLLDRDTGRMVGPWEIEPGCLVRVRETGDDLRLTEVEYDDADCTATLTLGTPVLTEEQRIARLSRTKRAV